MEYELSIIHDTNSKETTTVYDNEKKEIIYNSTEKKSDILKYIREVIETNKHNWYAIELNFYESKGA